MKELRPGGMKRHSVAPDSGAPAVEISRRLAVLNRLLAISADDSSLQEQLDRGLDAILSTPWLQTQPRGSIHLVDEKGDMLRIAAHRGFDTEMLGRSAVVPFGRGACGRSIDSGQTMFIDFDPVATLEAGCDIPVGHYSLPIRRTGRTLGVLTLHIRPGHVRDPDEHMFLVSVTDVLAAMIEHRQIEDRRRALLHENRELTKRLIQLQEEEYRRLARELHDEMGQSLTAIKADAALIVKHCQTSASPISRSAQAIAATADDLYELTRALLRHLRPGALDELGLVAALESYVNEWHARRPGIACTFLAEGELEGLGEEINIALYRVIQECLTNVIRHAAASRVEVRLYRARGAAEVDEVCLQVKDDGRGIAAQEAPWTNQRFGLLGMRERVEGLGGRIVLDSPPGEGLGVTVHLPLIADSDTDPEPQ